jgi:hypothetical protein
MRTMHPLISFDLTVPYRLQLKYEPPRYVTSQASCYFPILGPNTRILNAVLKYPQFSSTMKMGTTGPSEPLAPTRSDNLTQENCTLQFVFFLQSEVTVSHSYKITGNIHFHRILTTVYRIQDQSVLGLRPQSYICL